MNKVLNSLVSGACAKSLSEINAKSKEIAQKFADLLETGDKSDEELKQAALELAGEDEFAGNALKAAFDGDSVALKSALNAVATKILGGAIDENDALLAGLLGSDKLGDDAILAGAFGKNDILGVSSLADTLNKVALESGDPKIASLAEKLSDKTKNYWSERANRKRELAEQVERRERRKENIEAARQKREQNRDIENQKAQARRAARKA